MNDDSYSKCVPSILGFMQSFPLTLPSSITAPYRYIRLTCHDTNAMSRMHVCLLEIFGRNLIDTVTSATVPPLVKACDTNDAVPVVVPA
jgi:hypothetical protein